MLTPRFSVSQNNDFVVINIEAPFAHVKETEVFMEGNLFTFYSSPYYLRLHFSGCIIENEQASAKFDADKKGFVIHAPKAISGEKFENLDMLTSLLAPKGARNVSKMIEVMKDTAEEGSDDEGASELDWFVEQEVPPQSVVSVGENYGFISEHSGVFARLQSELSEVIDVQDPDDKTAHQRSSEREYREKKDFSEDHYLADTFEEDETLNQLILEKSDKLFRDELSEEQKDLMISMKAKTFKLNSEELKQAGMTLVDIMFAYCYDKRTTSGESNVESGWCISKLSSSLSWLEKHTNITETVITCFRRSLCYPLYRNWKLSSRVLEDVIWLLMSGKKPVLKALLEVHQMFVESEPRYILNQLYIDEMCVWIQQADEAILISLAEALQKISPEKSDVSLDLDMLESAAGQVIAEVESRGKDIEGNMQALTLDSDDSETDSTDSSTDSDSSDSDCDSDCSSERAEASGVSGADQS